MQQSTTQSGIVPPGGVNNAAAMTQSESIYGHSMDPADAPKKISESIRTLPAEQMYGLMKEMKEVIMVSHGAITGHHNAFFVRLVR